MIDFQIQRGPSSLIFSEPGVINPRLIIEEGCWYLCTDTAELFLGVCENDELTLKQINGSHDVVIDSDIDPDILAALRTEINGIKESYATKQDVIDAIDAHEGLAKKEEVLEVKTQLKEEVLPKVEKVEEIEPTVSELKTWIENKKYLQDIDLTDYAKKDDLFSKSYNDLTDKPEIPSVEGLASEDFVRAEIKNIDMPTVDTSNLVTTETLNSVLVTKANEVPFVEAKFVTNSVGNFKIGDTVQGLTIIELFAKLLGLTDTKPGTEDPEEPGENPEGIVDTIIAKQTPMYAITPTGSVEAILHELLAYNIETAAEKPNKSGFYQITDTDNQVIESGYQQISAVYTDMPYIIALPKILDFTTNVTVKSWNDLESKWVIDDITKNAMSSDAQLFESFGMGALYEDVCPEVDASEYTLWFLDEASTGIIYRFIINE